MSQSDFGWFGQGVEIYVGYKKWDFQVKWFLCIGFDNNVGVYWIIVQQWKMLKLGGQDLNVVLVWQLNLWYVYGVDNFMMFGFGKVVFGIGLDQFGIGFFFGFVIGIGIEVQILIVLEWLWIVFCLGCDFFGIDQYIVFVYLVFEFMQDFGVVVF